MALVIRILISTSDHLAPLILIPSCYRSDPLAPRVLTLVATNHVALRYWILAAMDHLASRVLTLTAADSLAPRVLNTSCYRSPKHLGYWTLAATDRISTEPLLLQITLGSKPTLSAMMCTVFKAGLENHEFFKWIKSDFFYINQFFFKFK